MKKKILLIFMVALLSFTVFAACSGNNDPGDDYDYPSEINTLKAECDADTVIDGRLTESRWQNLEWMEHTVPDVSIRVATSFSDKGIYVAAVSKDRRITYNLPYAGEDNTGIMLYIAAMDDFELKNRISAFFDCGNTPFLTGSYVHSSFVTVQGEGVNTNRSEGMTLECFFPWSEIGLEEKPENVRLTFCYTHKLSGGLYGKKKNIYPALSDGSKIAKYFIFGPGGFAENDADDAVLGDSVFGYSKSTEWKEIKEDDGSLTLKSNYTGQRISNPGGRYIFFKNAYAKSYMFSGVIKPNIDPVYGAGLNNSTPRMGIISGFDPTYGFTGAYFDLRKGYLDSGRIALGHMHYFFEKWEIASTSQFKFDTALSADAGVAGKLNADYTKGIPFTVLKDGSTIYYFIGRGNSCYLAYIDHQDYMNGETAFGFYSYAADVDITNIEYSILDGIDGEDVANLSVSEIADKYGVYRITVEAAANGFVTADSYGGRYGTGFNISVTPASTEYVLSSLKLVSKSGETEYIDTIDAEMSDGVYRFENISEDVTLRPVFTKAETAKASGTVTVAEGGNADCEITFASKNHKSRVYKVTSVSGSYSANLPKDDYTVTIVGKYCTGETREISLYSDQVIDAEISRLAVGGAVTVNGKKLESSAAWTTEIGGRVVKPEGLEHTDVLWFGESGSSDSFTASATLSVKPGSDSDPNGGFIVSDGNTVICIALLNNGYRVSLSNNIDGRYQVRNISGMANMLTGDVTFTLKKSGAVYSLYADYASAVDGEAVTMIGSFSGELIGTVNPGYRFTPPAGKVAVGLGFRTGATVTYYNMSYSE